MKIQLFSCLQETHFRRPRMIKVHGIEEFEIFELIREGKGGGGLALGAKKISFSFVDKKHR